MRQIAYELNEVLEDAGFDDIAVGARRIARGEIGRSIRRSKDDEGYMHEEGIRA